jgi:secreted trypsin-like serine protease
MACIYYLYVTILSGITATAFSNPNPHSKASVGFYPTGHIPLYKRSSISHDYHPIAPKIIGGSDVSPGEIPYQVSLQTFDFNGGRYHYCGGVVLNAFHVLTAGHCAFNKNIRNIEVVAGINNIFWESDPNEQRRTIATATVYPSYNPSTYDGDLAVIKLKSPFILNNLVQPIQLADESIEAFGKCRTSGWGNIINNSTTPIFPAILQKADLDIVPRAKCQEVYGSMVTKTMVCAADPKGDIGACNGDSGGPLVCKDDNSVDFLAGTVSWGSVPCAIIGEPSVYGNIAYFRDWIEEIISD